METEIDHLVAFARLYGYGRYFYPGDEAAAMDWDRFAIFGTARVLGAKDRVALYATLKELFGPIAPAVQIRSNELESVPPFELQHSPGAEMVTWQHLGAGLGEFGPIYKSQRLNRRPAHVVGSDNGSYTRTLDVRPYRGMRIRLQAALRAEVVERQGQAQMYLMVLRGSGKPAAFFDNMRDRPVTSAHWTQVEILAAIPEDATDLNFGGLLHGDGTAWFDEVRVDVATTGAPTRWRPLSISDSGFEDGDDSRSWSFGAANYEYQRDRAAPAYRGERSLRIQSGSRSTAPLFALRSSPEDFIDKPLGIGLSVRMPLALYSDDQGTLPRSENGAALKQALVTIDPARLTAEDVRLRIANVIIVWNALQHFYPYFKEAGVDWPGQLRIALRSAIYEQSSASYLDVLRRMLAAAKDGHGGVRDATDIAPRYWPSFRMQWAEGSLVVSHANDKNGVHAGDVVTRIDGVDPVVKLREAESLLSGSPQWIRSMATTMLLSGAENAPIQLELIRNGQPLQLEVIRSHLGPVQPAMRKPLQEIEPGIWYADLRKVRANDLQEEADVLARARGIVFDVRGYPTDSAVWVLEHLLKEPSPIKWMAVPQIVRPDGEAPLQFEKTGWNLKPQIPRISGRVAFLTDANAISFAESVLGYVEGLKLGDIVGSATAGTNGNIRAVKLPGNYSLTFTGMRVHKLDGSQLHLIGIKPTVSIEPTIDGIRSGSDEVYERALAIVRVPQ